MNIIKRTSNVNTSAYVNRPIKYIVIHYTAGVTSKSGSAANTASYFASGTRAASADFIVDDINIVQYNPDLKNRYCYHCGDKKSNTKGGKFYGICKNYNSIGIELCSTNITKKITNPNDGKWSYTEAVLNNAQDLIKYLMSVYNISADNVIRHYDVSGKLCPGINGWNADSGDQSKWLAFKKRLSVTSTNKTTTEETGKQKIQLIVGAQFSLAQGAKYTNNKEVPAWLFNTKLYIREIKTNGDVVFSTQKTGAVTGIINQKYIKDLTKQIVQSTSYRVKITANALNIRSGPSTTNSIIGLIRNGEVYTITEEKNGWGKLKSGVGWISLKYTKKI